MLRKVKRTENERWAFVNDKKTCTSPNHMAQYQALTFPSVSKYTSPATLGFHRNWKVEYLYGLGNVSEQELVKTAGLNYRFKMWIIGALQLTFNDLYHFLGIEPVTLAKEVKGRKHTKIYHKQILVARKWDFSRTEWNKRNVMNKI